MSITRDAARVILTQKQFDAWDYHERGMSYRHIAASLEISVASVRDRIFAARQTIDKHQREAA